MSEFARPARPHDAASLVLVDSTGPEPTVLMGRRPSRASFIPDAFVFPGGRLDREDYRVHGATEIGTITQDRLRRAGVPSSKARALGVAAIRETMEETGLMLAATGNPGPRAGTGWESFRAGDLGPDLAALHFLGRAITPVDSPKRFHARFFLANADGIGGTPTSNGELAELDWYPLSEAMDLPIIDVTEFILSEVLRLQGRPPEADAPVPLYCYRRAQPRVLTS